MQRFLATLFQRCPVCLRGRVFKSIFGMNKTCPQCGVVYEREHGYFLMAMLIAYAIGFLVLLPTSVIMALRETSIPLFAIVITLETIIVWPLIFRYSRVIWLHIDQMMDPRPLPTDASSTQTSRPQ